MEVLMEEVEEVVLTAKLEMVHTKNKINLLKNM